MSYETAITLFGSILALAGVYSLVNAGFVVLYRTTGVINFAQGQFMLVAALVMASLAGTLAYWPSLLVVTLAMTLLGVAIYLLLTRFLLGAEEFPKVVTTLMLATVITQVVSMTWGVNPRVVPSPTHAAIHIGDARLPVVDLIIAALAVVLVGALVLFVDRTVVGSRMRALADNEMLAVFSGMRVHVLAAIAWGMAGAAAAVAGIVYGQSASASLELPLVGLGAFPAAVLGGMDSITGIIPAAVLVAIIQTLAVYWFGALWGDIVVWSGMLAALLFVPRGLFGAKELKRL